MAGKRIVIALLGLGASLVVAGAGLGCDRDDTRSPTEPAQTPTPPPPTPTTPPKALK